MIHWIFFFLPVFSHSTISKRVKELNTGHWRASVVVQLKEQV